MFSVPAPVSAVDGAGRAEYSSPLFSCQAEPAGPAEQRGPVMHSLSAILLLLFLGWQSPTVLRDGVAGSAVLDYALQRERLYGNRPVEQSHAALLLVQSGSTEAQELIRESL